MEISDVAIIIMSIIVIGLGTLVLWQDREIKKRDAIMRELANGYIAMWENAKKQKRDD